MKLSRSEAVKKLRATADFLESAVGKAKKPKAISAAAAKPLKWDEHTKPGSPDKILTCDTVVVYDNGYGIEIKKAVSLRIDPRDPTNVRVDRASTGTWEAIDGGNGAKSIPEAKKIAQKWVEAVAAQKTLTPKISAAVVKAAVEQPKEGDLVYRRERGLFKLNDTVRGKVVKGKSGLMVRILSGSTVANMPLGKFVPLDDKWFTEEDFKKLHASATAVKASTKISAGRDEKFADDVIEALSDHKRRAEVQGNSSMLQQVMAHKDAYKDLLAHIRNATGKTNLSEEKLVFAGLNLLVGLMGRYNFNTGDPVPPWKDWNYSKWEAGDDAPAEEAPVKEAPEFTDEFEKWVASRSPMPEGMSPDEYTKAVKGFVSSKMDAKSKEHLKDLLSGKKVTSRQFTTALEEQGGWKQFSLNPFKEGTVRRFLKVASGTVLMETQKGIKSSLPLANNTFILGKKGMYVIGAEDGLYVMGYEPSDEFNEEEAKNAREADAAAAKAEEDARQAKKKGEADQKAADLAAKFNGFLTSISRPLARGTADKFLSRQARMSNKIATMGEHIERLVKEGFKIEDGRLTDGKTIYSNDPKGIGATGLKYAEYLIKNKVKL